MLWRNLLQELKTLINFKIRDGCRSIVSACIHVHGGVNEVVTILVTALIAYVLVKYFAPVVVCVE